ncbi:MAG: arsenic efflux protein [Kiritimatiellae bacterium]|nr:arsenic efflux protein [Kiritimatiellia bacterium]
MSVFVELVEHALMITGFVFVMMLVMEYLNVLTEGAWDERLRRLKHGQLWFASFLGVTPGCLGAFAAVSLYAHRVLTFGAIVATMVATSGDEAFVMLAMFPRDALLLFAVLFVLGIVSGAVSDWVLKRRRTTVDYHPATYRARHPEARCRCFSLKEFVSQWRHCTAHRGWLTVFLMVYLMGIVSGHTGHSHLGVEPEAPVHAAQHEPLDADRAGSPHVAGHGPHEHPEQAHAHGRWGWVRVTLLLSVAFALFVVVSVPDHFLEEHVWQHLFRTHVWRMFLWTFGALALMYVLVEKLDLAPVIERGRVPVLMTACLVGLIPQSGPHLIFVTLYAQGAVPFSTLVASCVVQDGHGMIPLLAHSRKAFVAVKAAKLAFGLAVGLVGLWLEK